MFPYAPDFAIFLLASIFFDIAFVLGILFIPVRRTTAPLKTTLPHCLIAALVVALAWAPKVIVSRYLGVGFFGWMAMATFTAAIALPAVGIIILGVPYLRARTTLSVKVLAACSLLAIPIALYALVWEPSRVVYERAIVPVAGIKDPITIVILSDIQCSRITARERRIAERVNDLHPDLILMPGDLWQERGTLDPQGLDLDSPIAQEFRDFLTSLRASSGVFFSPGDCEEHYDWRALIDGTGVQILDNTIARTTIRGREVVIGGTELEWYTQYAWNMIETLEQESSTEPLTILLSHRPDLILLDSVPGFRDFGAIDLLVCGHTHGGQVVVPGIGPLVTFSSVPNDIGAGGLHALDIDTWLYVSRGIGHECIQAPRIRFLCPPEVSILTIEDPVAAR